jgi:hypothetical protein
MLDEQGAVTVRHSREDRLHQSLVFCSTHGRII